MEQRAPITLADWFGQGEARFGKDHLQWRFVCPSCGHVQTGTDFERYGADPNMTYLNCIGRYDGEHGNVSMGTKPGPCNYTSGGLFNINPVQVKNTDGAIVRVFDFAEGVDA